MGGDDAYFYKSMLLNQRCLCNFNNLQRYIPYLIWNSDLVRPYQKELIHIAPSLKAYGAHTLYYDFDDVFVGQVAADVPVG